MKGPERERVAIEQRNAFNRAREEKPGCKLFTVKTPCNLVKKKAAATGH